EALDVHADDLLCRLARLVRRARELDASGLAPTADRHLRLDRDRAEIGARACRLVRGPGDTPWGDGDAERRKHLFGLVLEQLHAAKGSVGSMVECRRSDSSSAVVTVGSRHSTGRSPTAGCCRASAGCACAPCAGQFAAL